MKELLATIWYGIAASVRCVSFTAVILNAELLDQLRRTQTKQDDKKRRKCCFLWGGTQTLNSCRSLDYASNNIYIFQRSRRANRNIHLCQEKAPIYKLFRSKAPKTQQICHYRHARKTSGLFLLYNTSADFSSRNNFANLGSFAKFAVPVQSLIPW